MAQTDETITIEIPMSPPRRLLAPGRWRSFKTNPDRQVWQDAIGRACEPWRCVGTKVVRVEIDWGKSKPFVDRKVIRDLTERFFGTRRVAQTWSGIGRGTTKLYLRERW